MLAAAAADLACALAPDVRDATDKWPLQRLNGQGDDNAAVVDVPAVPLAGDIGDRRDGVREWLLAPAFRLGPMSEPERIALYVALDPARRCRR